MADQRWLRRVGGALAVWLCGVAAASAGTPPSWPAWGGPLDGNQRFAPRETVLTPGTVGGLQVKWVFTARGNVGATPSVADGSVYVTDDGGGIARLDAATGAVIWSHLVSEYTGYAPSQAGGSSPVIAGDLLVIGDRLSGAVIALHRDTGLLAWLTVVETNVSAKITASPAVHGSLVLVGTSSNEEYRISAYASYVASFRGSVAALDLATGALVWQTFTVPPGYTGGGVWGSGMPVLAASNTLFVATGNNYSVPPASSACLQTAATKQAQLNCLDRTDYVDAVLALDTATGHVKWARRLQGEDSFTLSCGQSAPAQPCPSPPGPDYDFASAPNLLVAGKPRNAIGLVGAGQKSGVYWALNPQTGAPVWSAQPGPGGRRGGIMWGSAADLTQVYLAENDYPHASYQLPSGATIAGGSWAALDQATGAIAWQVPVPGGAGAEGAVSVANGVVYAGDTAGDMVALDALSGRTLWSFPSGGSVACGAAIVGGVVYWGSGSPYGLTNNKLYAFSLPAAP